MQEKSPKNKRRPESVYHVTVGGGREINAE